MKLKLFAAAVAAALFAAPAAYAKTVDAGTLDPYGVGSASANSTEKGAFTTYYTVDLTADGWIAASLTISDLQHRYVPGVFELFSGVPGSGSWIASDTPTKVGSTWFASIGDGTGIKEPAGFYYVELTGNAGRGVSPGVSFSASVPETSTWAMLTLGFAGLGFAGFRARRTAISIA
jgi:hypothetical protein